MINDYAFSVIVTLGGIVNWNNQPDREAASVVRKGVGHKTILKAVATRYPLVNPIQSNPLCKDLLWKLVKYAVSDDASEVLSYSFECMQNFCVIFYPTCPLR